MGLLLDLMSTETPFVPQVFYSEIRPIRLDGTKRIADHLRDRQIARRRDEDLILIGME